MAETFGEIITSGPTRIGAMMNDVRGPLAAHSIDVHDQNKPIDTVQPIDPQHLHDPSTFDPFNLMSYNSEHTSRRENSVQRACLLESYPGPCTSPLNHVLSPIAFPPCGPRHVGPRHATHEGQIPNTPEQVGQNHGGTHSRSTSLYLANSLEPDHVGSQEWKARGVSSNAQFPPSPSATKIPEANLSSDGQSIQNIDTSSTSNDLGICFERILDVIDEAGFDSVDAMASKYYGTRFKEGTMPHLAQSRSKSRHLRRFLSSLQTSSKGWSSQDAQGYHEEIMRSAESIYVDELLRLKQSETCDLHTQVANGGPETRLGTCIAESFGQLFSDHESLQVLKKSKRVIRQQVCLFSSFVSPFLLEEPLN